MKTFNDINIEELNVGDKVEFLYKSEAKGNGTGSPQLETFKIKVKPKVFQKTIDSIVNNYPNKIAKYSEIINDLQEQWNVLNECKEDLEALKKESAELKGLKDDVSKERRKEITATRKTIKEKQDEAKKFIAEYKEENNTEFKTVQSDGIIFFKNFSNKEMNPEECYVQTVWYGGKSLDIRNGNLKDIWLSDSGYVTEELFNKETMEKL